MNRKNAEDYLKRKDVEVTDNAIEKVMKRGKIYGDPIAVCE